MKHLKLVLIAVSVLFSSAAHAAVSPLGVSIIPPAEFPPENFTVAGARLDVLVGNHYRVYGLDIGGLGNITTQESWGIEVAGLMNWNKGETDIVLLQAAGIANINVNKVRMVGVQVALYNSNQAESSLGGLEVGLYNDSPHAKVMGLQVGLYNKAYEVYGFQIGVFNSTNSLHGLQIGLVNYNATGIFAVAPILNFGF
jgi:hypothetical protein